jgi:hypothetical protein
MCKRGIVLLGCAWILYTGVSTDVPRNSDLSPIQAYSTEEECKRVATADASSFEKDQTGNVKVRRTGNALFLEFPERNEKFVMVWRCFPSDFNPRA